MAVPRTMMSMCGSYRTAAVAPQPIRAAQWVSCRCITTGESAQAERDRKRGMVLPEVMGPSTASLGNLANAQLIVAGRAGMEGDMSNDQRGGPVADRLPPAGRAA